MIKNYKFDDFILEIDDFISSEECDAFIEYFEKFSENGFTFGREKTNLSVEIDDEQLSSEQCIMVEETLKCENISPGPFPFFNEKFWEIAYPIYTSKYSIVKQYAQHIVRYTKIQKTRVGQGYHLWHSENGNVNVSTRLLTFILYLNDVEEGGETEFLYYSKRISPKKGKLIVWPAGFTHTHRGNPPLKNTKYVLTGWVEFA